jgi:hypothetical protein
MIAGTTTAAMLGFSFAVLSSAFWGTAALPFLFGSSIGFVVGSFKWYTASTQDALSRLDMYPALLRLHLLANFPREERFRNWPINEFRSPVFERSWVLKSMLVASWLTARPALEDIHDKKEAAVVETYIKEAAEVKALEIGDQRAPHRQTIMLP